MSICVGTPISEVDLDFAQIGAVGEQFSQLKAGIEANCAVFTEAMPAANGTAPAAPDPSFQSLISTPPKGPGLG